MSQLIAIITTLQGWFALIHPDTFAGAIVLLVLFYILGKLLTFLFSRAITLMLERDQDHRVDRLAASFISQFARLFIWIFVLMLYAHMVPALDRLGTALLASVSIASVVFGLAAQSTLANFVSGISLIFYRPFRMGDRLQILAPTGLETGIVENVSLGYTILQTYDNRRIVLSNSAISNTIMVNLTMVNPRVMTVVPFSIGYGADIDKAKRLVTQLADNHADLEEVVSCTVTALNTSSVDLTLRAWCVDAYVAAKSKYALLESIKKTFDREGIEIPYAYQNVILHPDESSRQVGTSDISNKEQRIDSPK